MTHGITENDVHDAADALVQAGERPTVERIRAHLGTGSPNTATRHLESWWVRLGARLKNGRRIAALPSAPAQVTELASRFREAALHAARDALDDEVDAERFALVAERASLSAEAGALAKVVREAQNATDDAGRARQVAEQRLVDLQHLCEQQKILLQDLAKQRDKASERAVRHEAELTAHLARIDVREAEHAHERTRLSEHVSCAEDRTHATVDRARQDLQSVTKQLERALRERDDLQRDRPEQHQALHDRLNAALRDTAVARAEDDKARSR